MLTLLRLLIIIRVIAKYRLDDLFNGIPLPWYASILLKLLPWRYIHQNDLPRGERLRLAMEELGPVFVKFGQMLSTRQDLLPEDVAAELTKLQDQVPPFCGQEATEIVERALGESVGSLFSTFDSTPLASASVAQVHTATLHCGKNVVVKVIRPGINKVIKQDVGLLYVLAHLVQGVWSDGRRLRPVEVVAEYEKTIFDELDLRKEAGNASQLKRNFDASKILYVPEVHWNYTHRDVMVMERIHGVPVSDIRGLEQQNTNFKLLAERGVEIFFTQVFRDSFFHADMHPGNIYVSHDNPSDPQYIALDFGIVGSLTPEDQSYLARNFLAFFKRDYKQVAQLHIDSGWVPRDTNVNDFETAIRSVCEPVFEKPLKEISFGQVLLGLFQTARRFNMEVQPQLVLLQKTLLNIEGLGRQLYPDLDLWQTAKPFLEDWMKQRMGVRGLYRGLKDHAPEIVEQLPHMPQLLHDALTQLKHLDQLSNAEGVGNGSSKSGKSAWRVHWPRAGGLALLVVTLCSAGLLPESAGQIPMYSWLLAAVAVVLLSTERKRL
ncbi:MAG: ubiquinone biosynthesis regulatory protein kinase UbiB [Motiliproteus sp.]|nr:ubiquinone biosynthesis regulatory protein kinase UbiB [Motiliproteus sp.]MCW9051434.1 ubiquinone biosynthesis regulatory protein kinase UbiB [Motiliproteus sp.]